MLVSKRKSTIQGFGIFSNRAIKKGTIIIDKVDVYSKEIPPDKNRDYIYPWSRTEYSVCKSFGSYFNHSQKPSVRVYKIDKINKTKSFIFLRDVEPNKELFLFYGNIWFKSSI